METVLWLLEAQKRPSEAYGGTWQHRRQGTMSEVAETMAEEESRFVAFRITRWRP